MHLSCSMQCWASACSAVPSSRKGGGTTQTMCPLHSKTVLLQLGEFRRWIHLQMSISISKMHLHLLIHLQNKQNSSQKHAAASRNKTCSLVWVMLVVVDDKHMQNDIQIPKTFCLNSSTSKRHKTFICSMQMNSKLVVLTKNVHKQLFLHQNQL